MKLYSPDITKPTEVNYYWHEKVLVEPIPKPKKGEWIMSDLKNKIMNIYDVRPSTAEYIQNIIEMIVAIAENEYMAGAETERSSE